MFVEEWVLSRELSRIKTVSAMCAINLLLHVDPGTVGVEVRLHGANFGAPSPIARFSR